MKRVIYKSNKTIIKKNGDVCIKYYTNDKNHKKIRKECSISECLSNCGIDVIPLTLHEDYITLPFMKHGDLYSNLNRYNKKQLDCIFKEIVIIIDTMHSVGVAHRDIKLENILIDDDYKIHLIDFGECDIFKLQWEETEHLCHEIKGTLPYMAPEEFIMHGFSSKKLDIWALGILYMTMTRKSFSWNSAKPYDPKFMEFLSKKNALNGLPDIFKSILDPKPETRITTADILKDKWFKSINKVSLKL